MNNLYISVYNIKKRETSWPSSERAGLGHYSKWIRPRPHFALQRTNILEEGIDSLIPYLWVKSGITTTIYKDGFGIW